MSVNEYARTALAGDVEDAELDELPERMKDAAEQNIVAIDETVSCVNTFYARVAAMQGSL